MLTEIEIQELKEAATEVRRNIVNNEMKSIDVLVYAFLSSMTTGKVCRHMVSSASLWKLFTY